MQIAWRLSTRSVDHLPVPMTSRFVAPRGVFATSQSSRWVPRADAELGQRQDGRVRTRQVLSLGVAATTARWAYDRIVSGQLTLDLGWKRSIRSLGPLSVDVDAPGRDRVRRHRRAVPGRTTHAMAEKLQVVERGSDMVLAEHYTAVGSKRAVTLETGASSDHTSLASDWCAVRCRKLPRPSFLVGSAASRLSGLPPHRCLTCPGRCVRRLDGCGDDVGPRRPSVI